MHRTLPRLATVLLAVFGAGAARSATYYVCNNASTCGAGWATGSDSHSKAQATSKLTPFRTIDYAENMTVPGDTVIVGSGVYNFVSSSSSSAVVYINKSGAPERPITLRSERKWGAVIDAPLVSAGFFFSCADVASHYRIDGFEVRNAKATAVNARDSSTAPYSKCNDIGVTNMRIHHFGHSGISFESARNSFISRNVIYDTPPCPPETVPVCRHETNGHNHFHGVYLSDLTDDILVTNNVIYKITEGWPIHVYDGHGRGPASNHRIVNNTLVNDNPYRSGGIVLFGSSHVLRNNLILNRVPTVYSYRGAIADTSRGLAGTVIENSVTDLPDLCARGCSNATMSGNVTRAKLANEFVNAALQDFRLLPTAVSIDRGTSAGLGTRVGAPSDDFDGRRRPVGAAPDVGAFEFGAASARTAKPPTGLRVR